jgi:N6-L-threonylcarbamoyladenine synthase
VLGLPYPGGPWVDKLAKLGNPDKYPFAKPNIPGYDYSFSGLKTSFLYTLRDMLKEHGVETIDELAEKVPNLREDMCASLQTTVVDILMRKLKKAAQDLKISQVAVAGGVSANSALRQAFIDYGKRFHWEVFIPPFSFTTDNAAMVCQAGYFKYLDGDFCRIDEVPYAKTTI